ncbi:MAG: hypothetical protein KDA44_21020 [Planctomycetales bacterium]|nr:hypothetical protein [Planctomycetales bacterium]
MATPAAGAAGSVVEIYGPMDNTGRTLFLKAGAEWRLDVVRSTGITGGASKAIPAWNFAQSKATAVI